MSVVWLGRDEGCGRSRVKLLAPDLAGGKLLGEAKAAAQAQPPQRLRRPHYGAGDEPLS